jgi:Protein kinase domain/RDD family
MMKNDTNNSAEDGSSSGDSPVYTCVCGADVNVDVSSSETTCPDCSRKILSAGFTAASMSIGATVIGNVGEPLSDTLPVQPGDVLDHFSVTELLGAGGMGAVFRARDESLQRFVAIKVIRGDHENAARRERIIQEARAQARVGHNHVVHIYYVGIHHQCPFFAMELVNGQTLAQRIRETRLPFFDIVRFGLETADALRHSAKLGVIHGDVKPANILLDEDQSVKLSDFGLAGLSSETEDERSSTGPAGTLNYMAPEVAGGQAPDVRSDMYSLGVMLYELSYGELPHSASSDSLQDSLKQRQFAEVRLPSVIPDDRPEEWGGFLKHLLHRDPKRRFATWEDLHAALSKWRCTPAPIAGRISRGVAWMLDMGCVVLGAALTGIIELLPSVTLGLGGNSNGGPLLWLVPMFLTWLHLKLGTSPGKKLLHLQITDMFGLRPSRRRLLLKAFSTYLPIWVASIGELVEFLWPVGSSGAPIPPTMDWLKVGVAASAGLWIVANAIWLLFSKRRQTLTDYLLGLRVTLAVN